ncbi:MAG: ABC transporter permease [Planctomycetes bacterium]|nr:ABC transporter permease [Planctomycetota bacterium]
MRKVFVVAVREYLAAVRTKGFIIMLVLMPVMMGGVIAAQALLADKKDTRDKRIAVIDRTGQLYEQLAAAAKKRNANDIFAKDEASGAERKQIRPRYLLEQVSPDDDAGADQLTDLSDRVREGQPGLFAFVVIGPDVLEPGEDPMRASIRYYSNNPTYNDARRWIYGVLTEEIREWRFAQSGLDAERVRLAMVPVEADNLGLVTVDEVTGAVVAAEKVNQVASIMVPFGVMMLMFMVVMTTASPLVQSVLEEKSQRIAEVLLGSVTPFVWMLGKLIGMVGVSLTIVAVYFGGACVVANYYNVMNYLPFHLVGWFVAFQVLAILMFGSVFLAVGAACTDNKEAQSAIMPVMLVVVSPMFVWMHVLQEPTSTLSTLFSLFPPATPMLMMIRKAVPPGIPAWQPYLGMLLVILTTVFCIFAAGRIFRVGILMQGKGAKFSEMLRWVVTG